MAEPQTTTDTEPAQVEQTKTTFYFPGYGLSVEAVDYDEALKQATKLAKKDK
jgi:hypothetical protein